MKNLITSEAVCIGHPDKMCDIIADNILDAYLKKDEDSRCAIEVMATSKKVIISGEVTSKGKVDIPKIVRKTISNIGYDSDIAGYNGKTIPIEVLLNTQSPDISMGVNKKDIGAGDQGMMYGYATNETKEYLPITCVLANNIARRLEEVRRNGLIPYLLPDGKCQVTLDTLDNKVDTIVLSNQHKDIDINKLRYDIKEKVIDVVIPQEYLTSKTKYLINPTGRFTIGGPVGDTGLTGRKIIVDTYGGIIPHGGGAFSGKDYTKVDRSGAYYCRYVAKNIVASGLVDKLMISVSYAIGVSKPVSIYVDIYENNPKKLKLVYEIIDKFFDFSPSNIISELGLKKPIYHKTTAYGHFGKNDLPYEKLDKVKIIKKYVKNS
jgi:S-adenosylmethionine synthetase